MVTPIVYDFVADLRHDNRFIVGAVPQGDEGTRRLNIAVTKNGVPYTLPTDNVLYTCNGTNGAGGVVYISCSVVNNKIRIDLPDSMVSDYGIGKYRVTLYDSVEEQTLSTFTFSISVEKDPTDISEVTRSDDYSALQELISIAQGFNRWITGTITPDSSIGNTLDLYLQTTNGHVYQKGQTDWTYKCTLGSTVYLAYATSSTGANFTTTYTGAETWLGICTSQSETQPTTPSSYQWVMFAGGDSMSKTDYGGTDDHTVRQADNIKGEVILYNIVIPSTEFKYGYLYNNTFYDYKVLSHILGYYDNGEFYTTSQHTTTLDKVATMLYIDTPTNKLYRWDGSQYTEVTPLPSLRNKVYAELRTNENYKWNGTSFVINDNVTTVTVQNSAIAESTVIEDIYTTMPGLNYLDVSVSGTTLTLTFPPIPTTASAMIRLLNVGNYVYPSPSDWNDVIPVAETVDIDFTDFDNTVLSV